MQAETKYWRAVLTRVIDVMIFLSSRGLAIRGSDEKLGSVHNGNFLGIVELLSKYDSFLASHLAQYGNKGCGSTSYLFPFYLHSMVIKGVDQPRTYSHSICTVW